MSIRYQTDAALAKVRLAAATAGIDPTSVERLAAFGFGSTGQQLLFTSIGQTPLTAAEARFPDFLVDPAQLHNIRRNAAELHKLAARIG